MQRLFLIFLLLTYSLSSHGYWGTDRLEDLAGEFRLSGNGGHGYCKNIDTLFITVDHHDVRLELMKNDQVVEQEYFKGVNTSYYHKLQLLNAIVYSRYRYQGKKLKRQESVWALGIIPAPYKDDRIILDVANENEVTYSFSGAGHILCRLTRVQ